MKRRYLSILLVLTMIFSVTGGFAMPAKGALMPHTATLTITPSQSEIDATTGSVDVIYTLKVTPPAGQHIGVFSFDLKAPAGMALSETDTDTKGGDGYWLNSSLSYHPTFNKTGIFETFSYTPKPNGYFIGSGTTLERNMETEADIMTIKATITDASKAGSYALAAENPNVGPDGTDTFTFTITSTPVIVKASAVTPVADEPVTATAVTVGQTLASSILSGSFKVSSTDSTAVTGTLAWTDSATVVNATGDFEWTFTPTDTTLYNVVTGTVNVVANPAALAINGGTLNQATQGVPYEYQLGTVTKGGVLPYTWSVSSGALPAGITLNSTTGYLAGTPTAAGTYSFSIMVTDSHPNSASADYTLLVNPDTTPPEFAAVPLEARDRHPGSKRVSFVPYPKDETVTAYYVIVDHDKTAPSKEQVKDGNNYGGVVVLAKGTQVEVKTNGYLINPYTELPADDTIYDTYVVIMDTAGNLSEPAKIELRTPVKLLAADYPKVGAAQAAGSKQVQILNKANGDSETVYWEGLATAYYVAVANGVDAPSAAQIKNGFDSTGGNALAAGNSLIATANTEVSALISLPADGTEYDVYVVLYKHYNSGYIIEIWSEVVKLDVKTPPAKSTVTRDPGNTGGAGASFDAATNTFSGTIDYYPAASGFPPTAGNYVGVQITAPTGITAGNDSYIKVGEAEYDQTAFDGANYFYYYPRVTAAGQSFDVTVSWDGIHEETITINVAADAVLTGPSASTVARDPGNTGGTSATFEAATNTFSGTIDYYPAASGFPPTAGNYVGVKITAPTDITVDQTYATFKYINQSGVETTLTGTWLDGDDFVYYYPKVTEVPQSFTVKIDWDGSDGYDEETIIINVAADAVLITPISIAAIPGVTAPVRGAAPVTAITETVQYTGTVSWSPAIAAGDKFAASTIYTATITLTPKAGYILTEVPADFFTVEKADSVTNDAGSGIVTAVFPKTAAASSGGGGGGTLSGFAIINEGTTQEKYGFEVDIPKGAVSTDTRGDIERFNSDKIDAPDDSFIPGNIFELTKKSSGDFLKPITVTLPYKKSAVDLEKYDLSIYWYDEDADEWVELDSVKVDEDDLTVSGKTEKTGYFAIIATEKKAVTPVEPPVEPEPELPVLTDISGHWAKANIEYLVEMGAISGYPDNTFRPDNSITRAEFAVVIVKAFDMKAASGKVFDDTASHWAKDYIATAAANGIVTGYSDTEFGPDDLITREQMAVMIVKAAKLSLLTGEINFSDTEDISDWASSYVVTAVQNELMNGYQDNSFKPLSNATRAEATTVIYNVLMK